MATESVSAVVFSPDRQQILLIQREDFHIWALPGGRIEAGESAEGAAIREALEETGYHIAIDRLVGHYWRPQMPGGGDRTHLFEGHIVGGAPIQSGPETLAVRFFPVDQLPPRTVEWVKARIADALPDSPTIIERTERLPMSLLVMLRAGVILRDFRNHYIRKQH